MAVTAAQANPTPEKRTSRAKKQTTLDEAVDAPGVVEPGDAPFDTTDPDEFATSVTPDKGAAAKAGYGVVNAVTILPVREAARQERAGGDRSETYEVTGPDGKAVKVTRNIDTGETNVG